MTRNRILWSAAVLACLAFPALAQTRSSVTGKVSDGTGGVLPGASVVLESPQLVGGAQTVATSDRGEYRFSDLSPGTYQVTATLQGFETRRANGVRVPFGTTLTLDLVLRVGVSETITVEERSPTVDVTAAESRSLVDKDLIQNLPLLSGQRDAYTVFELAPGSRDRAAFGGTRDSNELLLDGSPTTLPERQGTNSAAIATNWLEEVQVVALGASAEYGEFGGTVGNFVVRNGSNDFHGLLEYKRAPNAWLSDNTQELPAAARGRFTSTEIVRRWDGSAQLGGPLVKDRLFFFGGIQYLYDETQSAGAPAPTKQTWPRLIGKLNWAASKSVKADATVSYSKTKNQGGGSSTGGIETAGVTDQPNSVWSGRVTWTADPKTLVEFRTGGLDHTQDIRPREPGTKEGPPPRRDAVTGLSSANTAQFRVQNGNRLSFGSSVTRHAEGGLGKGHVLKLGAEFEHTSFSTLSGFPGGASFVDRNGVPDQVTLWAGDLEKGTGNRTTFFAQDDWKISERFTLHPGLRFSLYRGSTPTTGETFNTNPLSPRIGFAWDVAGDHKTVVRAHFGRFHEALSTAVWDFADTATRTPRITYRVLAGGALQELNRVTPAGNTAVDANVKHSYVQQFFVGAERELFPDFSVKLQYTHRDFENIYAFIDTRSVYSPVQLRDPGPDNVLGNADDGGLYTLFSLQNPGQAFFLLTNPSGATRKYDGAQVIAQKRFSRNWQMLASYTWSKTRGLVNNQVTDNVGSSSTGEGGVFANPNAAINAEGRNTLDFPHQFSILAGYNSDLIGGFNLSGSYTWASGGAWSRTATFRGLAQGTVGVRVAPRGAEHTDPTNQVNLRFEKLVPLGSKRRTLGVYLDCFNVFNNGYPPQARYQEASGGSFGFPLNWAEGRAFQISGRIQF